MSGEPTPVELMDRWMAIARRWRHAAGDALAPLGLTPGQERALRILTRADEPVRMGMIAERLGIVPRSATTVIDDLESRALVRRVADPENRRSVLVELTDGGRALRRQMNEARTGAAASIFGILSASDRAQLGVLLDKLRLDQPED